MHRYANTAGATIPIVLHETIEQRAVKAGDLLLFAAAGAGFTAGAALYRWH
jgi:3-oxoacyl-[acyl-carrier-protein] synthase-3